MNGLSVPELCYLFCCPPLPSRIAAKLAFLPPEPTYSIDDEADGTCSLHLTERSEWQYTHRELEGIEVFKIRTGRNNTVACMYVKNHEAPKYTILFTHGNAVDLGQMSSFFVGLGSRIGCNVFAFDYSGYGASNGKPSEKNMYADAEAAWRALRERYSLTPNQIILYGQSIGTVAAIDLATKYEVAGVILHSPLMSGMRVAFPDTRRTWFFDPFPNIEKVQQVRSKILVIHGTEDEVIDFSHGLALYERAPNTVDPLWVEGAGHNDVELYGQYLDRLRRYVHQELGSSSP